MVVHKNSMHSSTLMSISSMHSSIRLQASSQLPPSPSPSPLVSPSPFVVSGVVSEALVSLAVVLSAVPSSPLAVLVPDPDPLSLDSVPVSPVPLGGVQAINERLDKLNSNNLDLHRMRHGAPNLVICVVFPTLWAPESCRSRRRGLKANWFKDPLGEGVPPFSSPHFERLTGRLEVERPSTRLYFCVKPFRI